MYNYNNFQKNQKDNGKNNVSETSFTSKSEIALQIMQIARENNIPISLKSNLVEILSILDIAEHLPFEIYSIISQTITCIYEQEAKNSKK